MYDELVKRLRRCEQFRCRECEYEQVMGCRAKLNADAADAIEELSKPHWIPVTERLPEKTGSYLVYVYGEVTEMNFWHGKWHMLGDDYTKAVTHWMPLPQPPKEER